MSDSLLGTETEEASTDTETAAETTTETTTAEEKFDFVLDKYRAEGKTEQEAALEQAKGYNEIRQKLGDFKGAPDEYEIVLSDELKDAGIELDKESPLLEEAIKMAKAQNMSQDGFNKWVNIYMGNEAAQGKAIGEFRDNELKALGNNGQSRLDGINKYISANYDADTVAGIQSMATSSEAIKAIEAMITKAQGTPVAAEAPSAPSTTESEVKEMQFALDEHGNRRINTDPDFRREYQRKQKAVYGDAEHNVTVG